MPKKKHHIRLSAQERNELETILRKGRASAVRQRHARILLLADVDGPGGGRSDSQTAAAARTSIASVERVRRVCVEHGLEGVNMSQSAFLENRALPFNRTDFAGVVQSFVPAVDFQVRLNPGTAFTFSDASQTTFWNTKTRNNHLNMLFEDRAPHKLDKKRLCYFAFQREKRAAPSPTNK